MDETELKRLIEQEHAQQIEMLQQELMEASNKKCCVCGVQIGLDDEYTQCSYHRTVGCKECSDKGKADGFLHDGSERIVFPTCPKTLMYKTPFLMCIWHKKESKQ